MRRKLAALVLFLAAGVALAQDAAKGGLEPAEKALREGHYALALETLRQAQASAGAPTAGADALRLAIREAAAKTLRELLDESERLEIRRQVSQAIALLEKSALDFPAGRDSQALFDRLDVLRAKLSKAERSAEPNNAGPHFPEEASAEMLDLFRAALDLEAAWKLEESLAACSSALAKAPTAAVARPFASLAEDLQREIWCIQALRDAVEGDATRFQEMDLGSLGKCDVRTVAKDRLVVKRGGSEADIPWAKISRDAWPRLLGRANLDPYDRCHAAVLFARHGLDSEADRWLADVAEKDPKQKTLIDSILARRRGEDVPNYGYVWFRDSWMSFRDKEEFKDAAEIEKQIALFARGGEDREAALEKLATLGRSAMAPLRLELAKQIQVSWTKLRDAGFLKALGRIAEQRDELDKRRKFALELIFDEEKYFYPYHPPECPPEKAKLYPPVQAEVDRRVGAVRELWEKSESAPIGKPVREAIAWIHEIQAFADKVGARIGPDDELYRALLAIDPEDESIQLRSFCRDARERKQWLDWNRRIFAFNALMATSSSDEEKRQVAVTNQYRVLFGRKALAINEKLELAARKHSQEMTSKGYFSHFSPTAGLRTPFDRMKKEGYSQGAGENIASGMADAEGAHEGWIHSSGHHRNILIPSHREMGSGNDGTMWTQNFGGGKEYEEDPAWARN